MSKSSSTSHGRARARHDKRTDDEALLRVIAVRDDADFAAVVDAWSPVMLRMALVHVGNRAVAEEVVQEAWLTVLRDLQRFERRSALRTWVVGIVVNLARGRARAERRSTPFTDLASDDGSLFEPDRFRDARDRWPHHWATGPVPWPTPEQELLAGEARQVILKAVERLPPAQREVLVLRDIEGWSAQEACTVLALSDINQRVLLHRARTRVRRAIEDYFQATEPT